MDPIEPGCRHVGQSNAGRVRLFTLLAYLVLVCAVLGTVLAAHPGQVRAQVTSQEPPRLQDQVTDLTQRRVLANGRSEIEAALADLRESRNIQLFVLFVESTGSRSVTEYADETARRSSLGGNDALLLVALTDRSDALWRGSLLEDRLTDRELGEILSNRVEKSLASGDFAGAVVAGARGIADADGGSGVMGGFGAGPLVALVGIAVLIIGGLWLWNRYSTRRRQRQAAEAYAKQTEQTEQQAHALLIAADEAVRDAHDEIRFAELQFGEVEVVPYRKALDEATKELNAAFALRQQLDDDVPEAPDVRRTMVEQMLGHVQRSKTALDEQRQRIEQLREVERRAPEILAGLPALLDALEARIPEAEHTLSGLERFAEQSRASVAGNLDEARQRLAEAHAAVTEGQAALSREDHSAAGRSARAAQQDQAEVERLLGAIDSLAASLREAEAVAGSQVSAAGADVSAAREALAAREASGRGSTSLDRRFVEAEQALQQAQRELAAHRPDVLAASRFATQADAIADQILAELRQDDERRDRERRILEAQLQTAEASYTRAAHFVMARRRGMGSVARTRLAEARRHLEQARSLADTQPQAALNEARLARDLAEEAYALARQDFDRFGGGGWGGVSRGGAFPIPFPVPMGGGWGGGFGGGGFGGGGFGGGGGGGGSVGGRW
jgi:cytoskeletal protein RodZ